MIKKGGAKPHVLTTAAAPLPAQQPGDHPAVGIHDEYVSGLVEAGEDEPSYA